VSETSRPVLGLTSLLDNGYRGLFPWGTSAAGGDRGNTVVKVLCYKSEGRWFDPTMALGSTQPLTERSTRSISWG